MAPAPAVVNGSGCGGCGGGCGAACEDSCGRRKLCDRIKGLFHRDNCGCDAGCGASNGCGAAIPGGPVGPVAPPPGTEPPKKMPTTIGSNGVIITPAKGREDT